MFYKLIFLFIDICSICLSNFHFMTRFEQINGDKCFMLHTKNSTLWLNYNQCCMLHKVYRYGIIYFKTITDQGDGQVHPGSDHPLPHICQCLTHGACGLQCVHGSEALWGRAGLDRGTRTLLWVHRKRSDWLC